MKGQLIGEESGELFAACIVNHDCDEEYDGIAWNVDAKKEEVRFRLFEFILPMAIVPRMAHTRTMITIEMIPRGNPMNNFCFEKE